MITSVAIAEVHTLVTRAAVAHGVIAAVEAGVGAEASDLLAMAAEDPPRSGRDIDYTVFGMAWPTHL